MIHGSLNLAISFPGAALYIFNGTYDKYQCNTCVAPNLSPCPSPNFIELLLFATLISAGSWKYLYSINFLDFIVITLLEDILKVIINVNYYSRSSGCNLRFWGNSCKPFVVHLRFWWKLTQWCSYNCEALVFPIKY